MAAAATHTFDLVYSETRGRPIRVKSTFEASSIRCESGSGKVVEINRDDVEFGDFTQINKFFALRLTLKDGTVRSLAGFKRAQLEEIGKLVRETLGVDAKTVDISSKGWNWGMIELMDRSLNFMVDDKVGFEIPLSGLADARDAGRNLITIEIQQDDNARPDDDCITDIRFFVPSTADPDLLDNIRKKAKVGANASDSIAAFDQMNFIGPRGRFDVEIHPTMLKLKGLSASYNVLYKNLAQLYLLQRPDGHRVFIMNVEPPLRAGNTPHNFLLIQIKDEDATEVELNISEEKFAQHDKLSKRMEGMTSEVFAHIVRAISGKPVFQNGSFRNSKDESSIRCSLKNDSGFLFPLEKRFVYINKPTTVIRYDEIAHVVFERVGKAKKDSKSSFDMRVVLKRDEPDLVFASINRDELNNLLSFVAVKKIQVDNADQMVEATSAMAEDDEDDDSEEDSDFEANSDDDASDDASLSGSQGGSSDDDDSDADSDDDGKKKKKKKSKGSDSDSGSDDDKKKKKKELKRQKKLEKKAKKQKKKEEKKAKKAAAAASGDNKEAQVKPEPVDEASSSVKMEEA